MPVNQIVTANNFSGISNTTDQFNNVIVAENVIVSRAVALGLISSAIQFDAGRSSAAVFGSVFGLDGEAISMGATGTGSNLVTVGASGIVSAIDDEAVRLVGGSNELINSGQISALNGGAAYMGGGSCSLLNNGNIDARSGVFFDGNSARVVNNGSIVSTGAAIYFDGNDSHLNNAGFVTSVLINGDNGAVSNTGTIAGTGQSAPVRFEGLFGNLSNTGSITNDDEAVVFAPPSAGSTNTIFNDGLIGVTIRNGNAFVSNSGIDNFVNRGQVTGNILFNAGNDTLDNDGGQIDGRIVFGAGDDTLTGGAAAENAMGGTGNDTLDFGGGNDVFISGNDESLAGDGNDELDGGDGVDTYDARDLLNAVTVRLHEQRATGTDIGIDLVSNFENVLGGFGNDALVGDSGRNVLRGLGGNDVLNGLEGNDRLVGFLGSDTLIGNAGRDVMTGGIQNDVFDFNNVSDSGTGDSTRDIITDFFAGGDDIDLSTIDANTLLGGNQAFAFIGAAAFSNVAGQLRFSNSASAQYTVVETDVNGDGVADFSIGLFGNVILTAADFVL